MNPRVLHCTARGHLFDVELDADVPTSVDELLQSVLADALHRDPVRGAALALRRSAAGTWSVERDGAIEMSGAHLSEVVNALQRAMTDLVVESSPSLLSFHAAGVAYEGRALVLPGASGSGKTSMCMRLLEHGFSYMSDESIAVDANGALLGYPKPLGLKLPRRTLDGVDAGGLDLDGLALDGGGEPIYHVPVHRTGAEVLQRALPRLVVFVEYRAGASTALQPLGAPEATVRLLQQAQNVGDHDPIEALERTSALVASSRCWSLVHGDARRAARVLAEELMRRNDEVSPSSPVVALAIAGSTAGIVSARFADGLVLYEPSSGTLVTVDGTGAAVWELLAATDHFDVDQLVDHLRGTYSGEVEAIRHDVVTWIEALRSLGFVSGPTRELAGVSRTRARSGVAAGR